MKKVRGVRHLERAWRVIEENARSSKSEDVKKEIDEFRENASRNLKSLCTRLTRETFKFPPAKGIPIAKTGKDGKKDKAKIRPIVLANVESRIVQRAILDVLLGIPELRKYIHTPHSFGGIKKPTEDGLAAVPAAIQEVLNSIGRRHKFIASADISSFFTRIPKSEVTEIVAKVVRDDAFMDLFRKAIHVELSNMAELREKAGTFPIGDIGVAQGNSLSPLLGNIILYDFDQQMNAGDCRCIRYIDDFIILAPTRAAALARMKQSIALLSVHKMELSKEKSSKEPLPITHSFEFLGIELSNGFIRPASKAQSKHLNSLRVVFEESAKAFREYRSGAKFQRTNSLVATLRRVDGMSQGWAKHYRFCNDKTIFEGIDKKISEMIGSFIGVYSNTIKRVGEDGRRTLLGVGRLTEVEFKPFIWPKLT
jgi:retron-type reverse transcriptase